MSLYFDCDPRKGRQTRVRPLGFDLKETQVSARSGHRLGVLQHISRIDVLGRYLDPERAVRH